LLYVNYGIVKFHIINNDQSITLLQCYLMLFGEEYSRRRKNFMSKRSKNRNNFRISTSLRHLNWRSITLTSRIRLLYWWWPRLGRNVYIFNLKYDKKFLWQKISCVCGCMLLPIYFKLNKFTDSALITMLQILILEGYSSNTSHWNHKAFYSVFQRL